jgi:hypothetical protein
VYGGGSLGVFDGAKDGGDGKTSGLGDFLESRLMYSEELTISWSCGTY